MIGQIFPTGIFHLNDQAVVSMQDLDSPTDYGSQMIGEIFPTGFFHLDDQVVVCRNWIGRPTTGSRMIGEIFPTGLFHLDKRAIAKCYRTALKHHTVLTLRDEA